MVLSLSRPITATYWVALPTVIPALDSLGVPPPAAHMLMFYCSVLSEVSPPVALSPFAVAAITGNNPYKTMMLTLEVRAPLLLGAVHVHQPGGLAIPWRDTTVPEAAFASISAIARIVTGVGGYVLKTATWIERGLRIAAGLLLPAPKLLTDIVGLALPAVAGASQLLISGRVPEARATASR